MISPPPEVAAAYELRVQGHLDQYWSVWFDGFTLIHQGDGTTILHGLVRDQVELHGLLVKVRDLGTALISVTPLGVAASDDAPADPQQQRHPEAARPDTVRVIPSSRLHPATAFEQAKPMVTFTPAAPATEPASDPSPTGVNLMRTGSLLMGVGLALKKSPLLADAHTMPRFEGVTLCLLVAMSLAAFLGLRYPVKLLALLVRVGMEARVALVMAHLRAGAWGPVALTSVGAVQRTRCTRTMAPAPMMAHIPATAYSTP